MFLAITWFYCTSLVLFKAIQAQCVSCVAVNVWVTCIRKCDVCEKWFSPWWERKKKRVTWIKSKSDFIHCFFPPVSVCYFNFWTVKLKGTGFTGCYLGVYLYAQDEFDSFSDSKAEAFYCSCSFLIEMIYVECTDVVQILFFHSITESILLF